MKMKTSHLKMKTQFLEGEDLNHLKMKYVHVEISEK